LAEHGVTPQRAAKPSGSSSAPAVATGLATTRPPCWPPSASTSTRSAAPSGRSSGPTRSTTSTRPGRLEPAPPRTALRPRP
jgi:hypothetical protein